MNYLSSLMIEAETGKTFHIRINFVITTHEIGIHFPRKCCSLYLADKLEAHECWFKMIIFSIIEIQLHVYKISSCWVPSPLYTRQPMQKIASNIIIRLFEALKMRK